MQKIYLITSLRMTNMKRNREKNQGDLHQTGLGSFTRCFNGYIKCPVRKLLNSFQLNLCLKHILAYMILICGWLSVKWESSVDFICAVKLLIAIREERDMICFHNPEEENGYLSNWYL